MAGKKNFPLSVTIGAIDKITSPLKKIQGRINKTFAPLKAVLGRFKLLRKAAGLDRIMAGFKRVSSAVMGVASAAGGLILRLGAIAGAAAAAGFALVRSFASAGDNLIKTSNRLGIGVEALQEYRYAAESSGVSAKTFDMAMQRMGRRVAEAAHGTGEARLALKALGIEARDAAGGVRSIEDLLPEVAEKLSKVRTESERNALAMKLFDSEGVSLVQMFTDGAGGMEKMRAEARRLGMVMSDADALGGQDFTQTMSDLMGALKGVGMVIARVLMPPMREMFERLKDWLADNRERVSAFVREFMAGVPEKLEVLKSKLMVVWDAMQPAIQAAKTLGERFGWMRVAAVGLGVGVAAVAVALLGPLVAAVAAATSSVIGLGVAFLLTPFGAITAGITALVVGAKWLWENWGDIGDKLGNLWTYLGDLWDTTVGRIGSGIEWVMDKFGGMFSDGGGAGAGAPPPVPSVPTSSQILADRGPAAAGGEAHVRLDFNNVPEGVSVNLESSSGVPTELNVGVALPA